MNKNLQIWQLAQWLEYISAQHEKVIDLGLDRCRRILPFLNLQSKLQPVVITVAGTNGKGSVCAFLESFLLNAGYRVGLYTSPHLLRETERVRVQGQEISEEDLVLAFAQVEAARKQQGLADGLLPLTYYEYFTLAAVCHFEKNQLVSGEALRLRWF